MSNTDQKANREQWKKVIEDQEKSGLPQVEYCKRNNLSAVKFGYYKSLDKSKQKVSGAFTPVFSRVRYILNEQKIVRISC